MLTLPRIGRFFGGDSLSWEAHFQRCLFLFEHEKLQYGMVATLKDDFGMRGCQGNRQQHDGSTLLQITSAVYVED